jgi:hypothetical protein
MAFGRPQYYWAAYNLAYSIKRFNKAIQIALISEPSVKGALYYCPELTDVIDVYVDLPSDNVYTSKKLDPAKAKLLMYDLLPYDNNLFLDVDAVCLKDIEPLINQLVASDKNYQTHIVGSHTIDQGRDFKEMQWAWADDIWKHFDLTDTCKIWAINSSIQFIRKSSQCKMLFNTASEYFLNNPLPTNKLRMKWGGGQPDELYMNVALGIMDIDASMDEEAIHFAMHRGLDINAIVDRYYLQSYYGGKGFTPRYYTDWLDRQLKVWMKSDGRNHQYLINRITDNKYADPKR